MLLEPVKPHDNDDNVDEAQVSQDRDQVNVYLLVCFEGIDINAEQMVACECSDQTEDGLSQPTHVLSPDSVEALAPKKKASTALRFP
jgi:hypothetical protein